MCVLALACACAGLRRSRGNVGFLFCIEVPCCKRALFHLFSSLQYGTVAFPLTQSGKAGRQPFAMQQRSDKRWLLTVVQTEAEELSFAFYYWLIPPFLHMFYFILTPFVCLRVTGCFASAISSQKKAGLVTRPLIWVLGRFHYTVSAVQQLEERFLQMEYYYLQCHSLPSFFSPELVCFHFKTALFTWVLLTDIQNLLYECVLMLLYL